MQIKTRQPSFITIQALIFITTTLIFPTRAQILLHNQKQHPITAAAARKITQPPLIPIPSQPLFSDQRLALVYPIIQKFKTTITSDPFNVTATWAGTDICRYKGFYCKAPPNNRSATAVASVDFNGFHLSAPTLAGFLDRLPDLALFHANSNYFSGPIPPDISGLPYLYELDISNNKLSGPFPTAVFAIDGLTFLDIRFNSFSGSIPVQLFSKNLDLLFLNNNNFVTRLPENVDAAHVAYLTLANNRFFGPIPKSISKSYAGLSEVLLLNNMLSGCLPYELGLLKDVVVFDAGDNNLTGPLPFSLGCLNKLEVLNFAGNFLYGEVPELLCRLGSLRNLSLSENFFTGAGPTCMDLIDREVLDVRKNCIFGQAMQRSMAECTAFMAAPKYCPYSDTYSKIPCWIPQYGGSDLAPPPS